MGKYVTPPFSNNGKISVNIKIWMDLFPNIVREALN
jgi:hypothetical protein